MALIYKIIIVIVALVVIATLLQPLLIGLYPPFGLIILILLYLGVIGWLLGILP